MSRIALALMLLLISGVDNIAAAQDSLKHPSTKQKGDKMKAYLNSIGINNPRVIGLISTMDARMEGRNLRLAEEHFESGRLVLHYQMRPKISTRQLELKFQPAGSSNTEFIASRRNIMLNHRWEF